MKKKQYEVPSVEEFLVAMNKNLLQNSDPENNTTEPIGGGDDPDNNW